MTHSPVGLYSSALNHTNHERDHAGMTSQDLKKRAYDRPKNRGNCNNYGASADLYFCLNRVKADGTPIENPFTDGGNPWQSNAARANAAVTRSGAVPTAYNATKRPQSARDGRNRSGSGSGSGYRSSNQQWGNESLNMDKADAVAARQATVTQDVSPWPRDWGRAPSMTRAFEKADVGVSVGCSPNPGFTRSRSSDAGSQYSRASGSQYSRRSNTQRQPEPRRPDRGCTPRGSVGGGSQNSAGAGRPSGQNVQRTSRR